MDKLEMTPEQQITTRFSLFITHMNTYVGSHDKK